jgi:DNA-binding NtrC family response regulator
MAAFLIVDEDRNFRRSLVIGLRLEGHFAFAAGDVEEARAHLGAGRFDCCVVDAHLPGADELLEVVAAAGGRAFAMGPYPDLLEAAAGRHPHAAAIAKPFRAADLLAQVDASKASAA